MPQPNDRGPETAPAAAEAPPDARPDDAAPRGGGSLADRLLRQWAAGGRPSGTVVVLERTAGWDPEAGPYMELLGASKKTRRRAGTAWEMAQLASDATPVGRTFRPAVGLVGAGGAWYATRDIAHVAFLEPASHRTAAAALRAARARFELLAQDESDWDDLDEAIAAGAITDEPPAAAPGAGPGEAGR